MALRINFVDVVCDDSLKHLYANGKRIGCQFDIRLSFYKGQFLSAIDQLRVAVDGEKIPRDNISFCLKGQEYGIAQLHDLVSVFWPITEPATIKVFRKGGFEPGEHDIELIMFFRIPYMAISETQYMPIDSSGFKRLALSGC